MGVKLCVHRKQSPEFYAPNDMSFLSVPSTYKPPPKQKSTSSPKASDHSNQVPLATGRGLLDWIRHSTTTKDIAGTDGHMLEVNEDEMEAHCSKDNAWIILNGKVYNVAPYMEYHPGGELELMSGAGTDGTRLFNEVHPWVNYDSMLKPCTVGKFIGSKTKLRIAKRTEAPDDSDDIPTSHLEDVGISIEQTFKQGKVKLNVTLPWKIPSDRILMDLFNERKTLRILIRPLNGKRIQLIWDLPYIVTENTVQLNMDRESSVLCVQFTVKSHLESYNYNEMCQVKRNPERFYRKCLVESIDMVNHDSILMALKTPNDCIFNVPTGHHVFLQANISNVITSRPYTPVLSCMNQIDKDEKNIVYFLIKIYTRGFFTQWLKKIQKGQFINVSDPCGNFDPDEKLSSCDKLIMLAAGTGFTPMVKLINTWTNMKPQNQPFLLLFNKTAKDIYWLDELKELNKKGCLEFVNVLSEPDNQWKGDEGIVSSKIIKQYIPETNEKMLICLCGPENFTKLTLELLDKYAFKNTQIHIFQG